MSNSGELHIPAGINFECSGCAHCCHRWPVPVTRSDFEKISKNAENPGRLFRVLTGTDDSLGLETFTHTLEKRPDGLCEFLTEDDRCRLHEQFGLEMKPSMCLLFPYTFTNTPSGAYVGISFASSAALANLGRPLSEQRDLLSARFQLFQKLFPSLELDWSSTQLIDGVALSWDDYLKLEKALLASLQQSAGQSWRSDRALFTACEALRSHVPGRINLNQLAEMPVPPKTIDQVLLVSLIESYFPDDVYASARCEIDARSVLSAMMAQPAGAGFSYKGNRFSVKEIAGLSCGALPAEAEDLLRRFLYCRIFSKLYFGPGFNFLSVIAGAHHLTVLASLVRIVIKLETLHRGSKKLQPEELCTICTETVRTLERRLTVASFSAEAIAMLEVLISSPLRVERIISLAS